MFNGNFPGHLLSSLCIDNDALGVLLHFLDVLHMDHLQGWYGHV